MKTPRTNRTQFVRRNWTEEDHRMFEALINIGCDRIEKRQAEERRRAELQPAPASVQ
ncbi:MAG TPA: hypothetical protein VGM37_01220 [Armatimonadota bacterium]|jgi:hypothetical protein